MIEKRHLKRWQVVSYLCVYEKDTNLPIGHVVDITVEGMMVASKQAIATGKDFALWMEFPLEDGSKKKVALNAHSVWSNTEVKHDMYSTGFHLVDLEAEAIDSIRHLIESLR